MKKRIYSEAELPCWLSAADIAAYLGLGLTSVYEMVRRPGCPRLFQGRRLLVPRDAFLKFLEEQVEEQNKKE